MIAGHHLSNLRPFPGLRPYGRADREWFFGRETQVFALYRLVDRTRFAAVVGGSGSGKSSLVAGGLLPALDDERDADGRPRWTLIEMRPGAAPMARLAEALAGVLAMSRERIEVLLASASYGLGAVLRERASAGDAAVPRRVLLLVDQFEELFRFAEVSGTVTRAAGSPDSPATLAGRSDEAAAFVHLLLEATRDPALDLRVVLTMRADFLGDCARFHGLPEAVAAAQFLVPGLTRDQREAVIRRPLEKSGAQIEDALVQRLLNDAGAALDDLPVLQHALMRLWDAAGADLPPGHLRRLTESHYRTIGRLELALSQHAEAVMRDLAGQERVVQRVFQALTELDRHARAVRRPLQLDRLIAEVGTPEQDVRLVLDRFRREDTCFLVPAASQPLRLDTPVDISHEALIRRWVRMNAAAAPELGRGQGGQGWLWEEAEDGRRLQLLWAVIDDAPKGTTPILPFNQLKRLYDWWKQRRPTPAWTERYGADFTALERLFKASFKARSRKRYVVAAWLLVALVAVGATVAYREIQNAKGQAMTRKEIDKLRATQELRPSEELGRIQAQLASTAEEKEKLAIENEALRQQLALTSSPASPVPPHQSSAAEETIEVVPATDTPQREVPTLAGRNAPVCDGAMWVGSNQQSNLRDVAIPGSVRKGGEYEVMRTLQLRSALPDAKYVSASSIGIVPQGTHIIARGEPQGYDRPSGEQFWLEVSVPSQICSLIYYQYFGDPVRARELAEKLKARGYAVPGLERLSSAQKRSEVRYYYSEDERPAKQLARDAGTLLNRNITVNDSTAWPRQKPGRGVLELWVDISQ